MLEQWILIKTKKIAEDRGAEFYFIYLPEFWRYELKELDKARYDENIYRDKGKIIEMLRQNGIKYIDLDRELFSNHKDYRSLFPFRKGGHYNEEGYKQASNVILKILKNNAF